MQQKAKIDRPDADSFKYPFRPSFGTMFNSMFADGAINNKVEIKVRLEWKLDGQDIKASQDFVFGEEFVKDVYENGKSFTITVSGIEGLSELTVYSLVEHSKDVYIASAELAVPAFVE